MSGYGYGGYPNSGGGGGPYVNDGGAAADASGGNAFRGATPNSKYVCPAGMALQTGVITCVWDRGQYSDAVLSSLESQNDSEVEGISAKVKMLKNVRPPAPSFLRMYDVLTQTR